MGGVGGGEVKRKGGGGIRYSAIVRIGEDLYHEVALVDSTLKREKPVFWGCARPLVENNEEQKLDDRHCWVVEHITTLYMGVK